MYGNVANDKRTGQEPVPANLGECLNDLQMGPLHRIEEFGWRLWFIRRPLFQDVIAVVANSAESDTAVIETDGTINKNHGLAVRH